jgi:hypothetical protein
MPALGVFSGETSRGCGRATTAETSDARDWAAVTGGRCGVGRESTVDVPGEAAAREAVVWDGGSAQSRRPPPHAQCTTGAPTPSRTCTGHGVVGARTRVRLPPPAVVGVAEHGVPEAENQRRDEEGGRR